MRGYRDDLATAQQRILHLEEQLDRLPPRPRPWGAIITAIVSVVIAMGTLFVCGAIVVYIRGMHSPIDAPIVPAPVAVTTETRAFQLFWPAGVEPLFVDVNADGQADLITLLWDGARPEAALRVVALDSTTHAPLWHAGPWPTSWASYAVHIERAAGFIVVTDSQGGVHALRLATGETAGDYTIEMPSSLSSLCPAADGSAKVIASAGYASKQHVFDLDARSEIHEDAGMQPRCLRRFHQELPECDPSSAQPCRSRMTASPSRRMDANRTIEHDDLIVTLGTASGTALSLNERPASYVAVQGRDKKLLWEGVASSPGDKVHLGGDRLEYADGKVFVVYEAIGSGLRLVGRDARDGTVLFAETVGRATDENLWGLTILEGRVYVRLNGSIRIHDATTGAPLYTVEVITVDLPVK